ncbi:PQQ-dependent sugar dehydrogenase [uncultured Sphingomonas sp.]|uniref:PQQ-dependent sugar dehydrogenase n=1 Tax=uncultured Sphingomonas sp. TaxID=158754 RepID=UPI0025F64DF5|nr:PQQ-dependent sugar dehydrogenase [uncultured Sphingomonas sp.]
MRLIAFTAALLASTACSAEPQRQSGGAAAASADVTSGPQGPQVAGSNDPVPKNAPAPTARNVPATTGRANTPATPPPVAIAEMGQFDAPFAIAFLPDAGLLVTEKAGALKHRAGDGRVTEVGGVPAVAGGGQGGLLDVAPAPDFATSRAVYLTYAEPRPNGGSSLALMRARLDGEQLRDQRVIWRAGSDGPGGQFGAVIAFAPDGKSLFLTSGERQRFTPAQDPEQLLGKIVRLTLDGKAWPGNPMYKAGGARAMIWSSGHRNPYGLVLAPDGRLWEEEMGPRGGDELNLIEPGKNYGWPLVSNGDNYSGVEIPDHPSRPEFQAPVLWWNPVISPGGMIAYTGAMFPAYRGSLFIAGLSSKSLVRVAVNGAEARAAERWDMGERIRDVAQAPDGAIWVIQDGEKGGGGRLLRLTPKG